jgi:hypothetical protein
MHGAHFCSPKASERQCVHPWRAACDEAQPRLVLKGMYNRPSFLSVQAWRGAGHGWHAFLPQAIVLPFAATQIVIGRRYVLSTLMQCGEGLKSSSIHRFCHSVVTMDCPWMDLALATSVDQWTVVQCSSKMERPLRTNGPLPRGLAMVTG